MLLYIDVCCHAYRPHPGRLGAGFAWSEVLPVDQRRAGQLLLRSTPSGASEPAAVLPVLKPDAAAGEGRGSSQQEEGGGSGGGVSVVVKLPRISSASKLSLT